MEEKWIRRFDAHMERGNELMVRNERAFHDLLAGIREINLRQERVFREFMAELADGRAQLRANTEATWKMLDRFGEGPTPAS